MAKAARANSQEDFDDDAEQSMLAAAMAATESEIFQDSLEEQPLELDGDTALEQMGDELGDAVDPADESDEPAEDDAGELEAAEEEPAEEQQPDMLPSWRRPEATAIDPEVARLREENARLQGRLEATQPAAAQQQQPQQPQAPQRPDILLDPDGYEAWRERDTQVRIQQAVRASQLEASFRTAEAAWNAEGRGDEFRMAAGALDRLTKSPDPKDQAIVRYIVNHANPPEAMMDWGEKNLDLATHRETMDRQLIEQTARRLGVDPADLESLQAQNRGEQRLGRQERQSPSRQPGRGRDQSSDAQQARPQQRRLPSLNGAGATGREISSRNLDPNGFDGSESAIFNFALQ